MLDTGHDSGRRRRRRRRHSSTNRRFLSRPLLAILIVGLLALTAAGLTFALGGTSPLPSPASTQVARETLPPIFTPAPGATPTTTPVATSRPSASVAPSPTKGKGTVAKRIVIDRLNIDIPVVKGDGVDAPLGKAAHYPTSAWPGGGTNIYLYAHARDGMFIRLWDAEKGDRIELKLVDGTSKFYVVTKVLPKVKWNALQYLDPTPTEQLTLQTCTSYQYTAPRFLVIAVPEDASPTSSAAPSGVGADTGTPSP